MEILDDFIKEIRENGYNQKLVNKNITDKKFMKELVERYKEYD